MAERDGKDGPQAIGPLLKTIIQKLGLEELADAGRILEIWSEAVGPAIAAHAQPHSLRKGLLVVHVDSSVWLSQLERYRKQQIRESINRQLPRPLVKRIVFRIGELSQ